MTSQETIEWLEAIEEKYIHGGDDYFDEKRKIAISNAVNALERQIPKKPLPVREVRSGRIVSFTCPNCNHESLGENQYRFNHCEECGQALDWSDTGENI